MCIFPAITIMASTGEFVFSFSVTYSLTLSLNCEFVVANCGVAIKVGRNSTDLQSLGYWATASYCLAVL